MREYLRRILSVHRCIACRNILSYDCFDEAFCPSCKMSWQISKTENCPECYGAATECHCMPKQLSNAGAITLRKLFFYSAKKEKEVQNKLVYYLKHHKSTRASRFVAGELAALVGEELATLEIEKGDAVIVGVPRGKTAVNLEGFDQSELVCRELASALGIAYEPLIKRRIGGREQKTLSAAQRKKNIKNLMYIRNKDQDKIKGKYVLLFDDIVTSGASMSVCLSLLRRAGAKGVICLCLASDLKKNGINKPS